MRFFDYLQDQKWLIVTYLLIISFVVTVILVDSGLMAERSSITYIIIVASIIFASYLLLNYLYKIAFYRELESYQSHDEVIHFPKAVSKEAEVYLQILKKQQENYLNEIAKNTHENKEWLEYMTSWFHEIKTPVSVSRMIYEVEEHSESLAEEMDKIEYFLEQALYYARLSDFHKDYLIQEVDLERTLKNAIKSNTKTFLAKKIALKMSLSGGFTVLSDKKGLYFIIIQIMSNALKYSGTKGEIQIRIDEKARTISIRDNGIGIDAEDLPRIFDKGFTGKNGRDHQKSTGMGLYLAKRMSENLGHSLSYSSENGCYTEATIFFPKEGETFYRRK